MEPQVDMAKVCVCVCVCNPGAQRKRASVCSRVLNCVPQLHKDIVRHHRAERTEVYEIRIMQQARLTEMPGWQSRANGTFDNFSSV